MNNQIYVRCLNCQTINRLFKDKLNNNPKCGKCKNPIQVAAKPVHASEKDFQQIIDNAVTPVVVDFYADWCGPCRAFSPVYEEFALTHSGEVLTVKVNVDQNPGLSSKFGISAVPTILIINNGKVVQQISGAPSKEHLESLVTPYI